MTGIPSVAFAVSDDELPAERETCWDVGALVQRKIVEGVAWQTAFENAWQRTFLERARAVCAAPALQYLFTEVSVLGRNNRIEGLLDPAAVWRCKAWCVGLGSAAPGLAGGHAASAKGRISAWKPSFASWATRRLALTSVVRRSKWSMPRS